MIDTKILWGWTAGWREKDIQSVWLPALMLANLEGQTTLYLFGEFTEYHPMRLTPVAKEILSLLWDASSSQGATIEKAPRNERQARDTYLCSDQRDLVRRVAKLSGAGENYVVKLGPFTLAEQDGTIFVIQADPSDLQRLFENLKARAAEAGWVFMDVIEDE